MTADARHTGLPSGSFDLVHARALLVNLTEPAQAVAEMVRLAKPGGQVAAAEPDSEHVLCYPPLPAFEVHREAGFSWVRGSHGLLSPAGLASDVGLAVCTGCAAAVSCSSSAGDAVGGGGSAWRGGARRALVWPAR